MNNNGFLKRGGGILIYTHTDLDVRTVSDEMLNFSDENIEMHTVQVKLPFTRPKGGVSLDEKPLVLDLDTTLGAPSVG